MKIFFWAVDLLIPIVMIVLGFLLNKKPPKKINYLRGYRTKGSMKSLETWDYANKRIGELWWKIGFVLLVIIVISKLITPVVDEYLSIIHSIVGLIAMIIGIPFVEKELKDKFDENGKLK